MSPDALLPEGSLSGVRLPEGYLCRRPQRNDIAAIVTMMRAEQTALIGETDVNEDELFGDWHIPRFCLERDAWLIQSPGDRATGYAWIWEEKPHAELSADFHVDPEDDHRELLSSHLLAHIEARSGEYRTTAGGARVLLGIPAEEEHDEKLGLLARRGFTETRRFHRMRIDLRAGHALPVWPNGIQVGEFRRRHDEAPVHQALEEAFAGHFRFASMTLDEWERYTFANEGLDTELWLIAWDGAEVVGTCLAFDNPDCGYVDDIAVRKPWRGRGLGLALLLESFARLAARGQTEVVLGVDGENPTGALALYERAGMHIAQTRLLLEREIGGLP